MRSRPAVLFLCILLTISLPSVGQTTEKSEFLHLLGSFPEPCHLNVRVLESVHLVGGIRSKIEYTVEESDDYLGWPTDVVRAYLFVPDHAPGDKLPTVVAIHQDGPSTHLGKLEPTGLGGDLGLAYGRELFERGYVVIIPDRYYHGERRPLAASDHPGSNQMRDLRLWLKRAGQMILRGRTHLGKEVYDLKRAVDVLVSHPFVDPSRIGAIGHSAGGNVLVYFMFADERISCGVSSVGFFELLDFFGLEDPSFANAVFALPGLAEIGRSADYLGWIAPRPFLMTRGLAERSSSEASRVHVEETRRIEQHARRRYAKLGASDRLETIYFEGGHAFPDSVKQQAFSWLDSHLKGPRR